MGYIRDFGTLRAHLQERPSPEHWSLLWHSLEHWPDASERDEVIVPYVAGALARWPDALRVAPEHWVRAFLDGHAAPYLFIARRLDLQGLWLNQHLFERLLHAPQLANIHHLVIHGARLSPIKLLTLLATAPWAHALRALTVHDAPLGAHEAQLERALDALPNIVNLRLHNTSLTPQSASRLLAHPLLPQLDALALTHAPLSHEALVPLADTPLPRLRALDLSGAQLHEHALPALVASPEHLPALEQLDLSHNVVRDTGARALFESALLSQLTHLSLAYGHISDEALEHLARHLSRDTLRSLILYGNPRLTDTSAVRLARLPQLHNLERLRLDLCQLSEDGWHALQSSPHLSEELKRHLNSQH